MYLCACVCNSQVCILDYLGILHICLYVSASLCVSVGLCFKCLCMQVPVCECMCIYLRVCLCVYVAVYVFVCLCMHAPMCVSLCFYVSVSVSVLNSVYLYVYVCVCE